MKSCALNGKELKWCMWLKFENTKSHCIDAFEDTRILNRLINKSLTSTLIWKFLQSLKSNGWTPKLNLLSEEWSILKCSSNMLSVISKFKIHLTYLDSSTKSLKKNPPLYFTSLGLKNQNKSRWQSVQARTQKTF